MVHSSRSRQCKYRALSSLLLSSASLSFALASCLARYALSDVWRRSGAPPVVASNAPNRSSSHS